ncbi:exopolysaccharide biosynthesis protein YbjH [Spirosoma oryzae]|uniref:Exopolysaccharide biosynthesis protein YbjH n=1 Tax=Spirosoma oryzae TaxID=1469603 RepID=A0A2T0RLR1_9BACT|nr:YjbH domain-containing protein [Spirosoma oryzae]PRY22071.1 exopolysaccharide biosynthesis protein YbjH [Spirosoma oryzae]
MIKRSKHWGRFVLLLMTSRLAVGQSTTGQIVGSLENLTVDSAKHRVFYEQRLYRNPMTAMLELSEMPVARTGSALVPLFQGVPIAQYQLTPVFRTTPLTRTDRSDYAAAVPFNGRAYRFDFRLHPEFMANFGNRERTVESKTNLLLQSQLYLRRGLVLNWGILFPIINDLDNQAMNVRPAPIFLNQFLALNQADFMSISAGLFYNDRYGLNVQYRHADLNSPWSYGLETSLTGYYVFPKNDFYYQSLSDLMILGDVAYRIGRHNVTLKVSGGQYLFNDRGGRIDFIRQFPNVEVGFFATKTGNGSTAGFNFAIPIPPGRIVQSNRVRLRTTEEFRWEYNYSRGYNIATRYKVGYQLDALLRQYHNSYLKSQLGR